jgi:hypothetical protein
MAALLEKNGLQRRRRVANAFSMVTCLTMDIRVGLGTDDFKRLPRTRVLGLIGWIARLSATRENGPRLDNFTLCQPGCYCAVLQQFHVHGVMNSLYYP